MLHTDSRHEQHEATRAQQLLDFAQVVRERGGVEREQRGRGGRLPPAALQVAHLRRQPQPAQPPKQATRAHLLEQIKFLM